jgi:hypothetical protein
MHKINFSSFYMRIGNFEMCSDGSRRHILEFINYCVCLDIRDTKLYLLENQNPFDCYYSFKYLENMDKIIWKV